jgi:hypothetical protein
MKQLLNSFIRGFGSTLGRAAARNAIQSGRGSSITGKGIAITLIILMVLFLGALKLAHSYQESHPSKYVTFRVKAEDKGVMICEFEDMKGKSKGIGSTDLFRRNKEGHLESIPDSLLAVSQEILIKDPMSDCIQIKSDGYEIQIVKIENRDTIDVILHKIK